MHGNTRLESSISTLSGKLAALAYSLLSYAFFLLVFIYFIGFLSSIGVPKGIDTAVSRVSWPWAIVINVLLITLFAIQHSGMARKAFKHWWLRFVPAPIERATYVLFSSAVLALMIWLWQPVSITVWRIESPLAVALLTSLYWLGWALVLVATFLISHLELFGIKQALDTVLRLKAPDTSFKTPLLYKWVRHPMYAGFLMAFWATPHMTVGRLVFAVTCTLYIVIGSRLEEKDLLELFGDPYRRYQQRIGRLIPFVGRRKLPVLSPQKGCICSEDE
ncbi:MAG: isoprenylcysteine carboxylmethyltransferase family protein [Pseudomonas lundensis]|uniref:methanethiol S-methyltransferase n=1 Tax=Pseudomonas lundensis TaxID=86185 RepID=UPI000642336F|nr:methanethiol S-methyltransferase [Pseudomonas lundensis]NLT99504.1 isoprenylcysteine carboxylmethyltransferase family protein [Pseudomonas lundensis]NNA29719.1 isoprenylcysteine carboxylmethyltransferase family protein [Pseudomonas lundensis]NNA38849.1 isoprenylcysteine carboxylmethyltransferase family protein [Pseudomonas lundensis]